LRSFPRSLAVLPLAIHALYFYRLAAVRTVTRLVPLFLAESAEELAEVAHHFALRGETVLGYIEFDLFVLFLGS